jgi:hypothetical protein
MSCYRPPSDRTFGAILAELKSKLVPFIYYTLNSAILAPRLMPAAPAHHT